MKKLLVILLIIPLLGFTQIDTTFNSKGEVISVAQEGINNLVTKYKTILKNTGGMEGWRLQIKSHLNVNTSFLIN